jgi:hypothetical protein
MQNKRGLKKLWLNLQNSHIDRTFAFVLSPIQFPRASANPRMQSKIFLFNLVQKFIRQTAKKIRILHYQPNSVETMLTLLTDEKLGNRFFKDLLEYLHNFPWDVKKIEFLRVAISANPK